MPTEFVLTKSQWLLDWPDHWDKPFPGEVYGPSHPFFRKLFRERLKVMLVVLANTLELFAFDAAAAVRDRLYNSRSARIGAAIEAARLDDDTLSDIFRSEGACLLQKFECFEADSDILFEGLIPFDYDENGVFLHVERRIAAFGAGLHRLDNALADLM